MDEVAERYLRLGLGLGKHVDGLVDGYYGPPELAESDPQSLAELLEEARTLRAQVAMADLEEQRRRWLSARGCPACDPRWFDAHSRWCSAGGATALTRPGRL